MPLELVGLGGVLVAAAGVGIFMLTRQHKPPNRRIYAEGGQ